MSEAITIAIGATQSSSIPIKGGDLVGLEFPASKTGTGFKFKVSRDNVTFIPLIWNSAEVTITATSGAASAHAVDPMLFTAWPYAVLVASSAQAAAITVQASLKRF